MIEIISSLPDQSPNSKGNKDKIVYNLINNAKAKIRAKKEKLRNELVFCKHHCDTSCKRVKSLKEHLDESEDKCRLKCYLACSNNTLNKLLK